MTRSLFINRDRQPADPGHASGSVAVLLCRGPSFTEFDRLDSLGLPIMAVNGYDPAKVRPTWWVSMDQPSLFDKAILTDGSVRKFMQASMIPLHEPAEHTYFYRSDCRGGLIGDFFDGHWIDVGDPVEQPDGMRCVMLPAFRILAALGVQDVLMLGCDAPATGYPHDPEFFIKLDRKLSWLAPAFAAQPLRVWNCNPRSGLTCFPRLTLDEALLNIGSPPPVVAGVGTDAFPAAAGFTWSREQWT